MSKISVIVPIYNVEPYLCRCVDSVLAQTFSDFDLALVDDGSPDNCGSICDAYAAKDKRIHVIHQENGGLSAARNAGIDWAFTNSDSEWITFIDSDDWVHPHYLDRLLRAAEDNHVNISTCGYQVIQQGAAAENTEQQSPTEVLDTEDYFCVVEEHVIVVSACAKLFKKTLFTDIRFPVGKLHEDVYTTPKLLFQESRVALDRSTLYYYFQSPNSIMRSEWTPERLDEIDACEQILEFFRVSGYEKARRRMLHMYCVCLVSNCLVLQRADISFRERYLPNVISRLRKLLVRYGKALDLPVVEKLWVWEIAFPRIMNVYWLVKALCTKIIKVFGG